MFSPTKKLIEPVYQCKSKARLWTYKELGPACNDRGYSENKFENIFENTLYIGTRTVMLFPFLL